MVGVDERERTRVHAARDDLTEALEHVRVFEEHRRHGDDVDPGPNRFDETIDEAGARGRIDPRHVEAVLFEPAELSMQRVELAGRGDDARRPREARQDTVDELVGALAEGDRVATIEAEPREDALAHPLDARKNRLAPLVVDEARGVVEVTGHRALGGVGPRLMRYGPKKAA